jgi:hypothetical protein
MLTSLELSRSMRTEGLMWGITVGVQHPCGAGGAADCGHEWVPAGVCAERPWQPHCAPSRKRHVQLVFSKLPRSTHMCRGGPGRWLLVSRTLAA